MEPGELAGGERGDPRPAAPASPGTAVSYQRGLGAPGAGRGRKDGSRALCQEEREGTAQAGGYTGRGRTGLSEDLPPGLRDGQRQGPAFCHAARGQVTPGSLSLHGCMLVPRAGLVLGPHRLQCCGKGGRCSAPLRWGEFLASPWRCAGCLG